MRLRELRALYQVADRHPSLELDSGVDIRSPHRFYAGVNVLLMRNVIIDCGAIEWSKYQGYVRLGNDCIIGPNSYFIGAGGIEIGSGVRTGAGTMIFSSEEDFSLEYAKESPARHVFGKVVVEDYAIIASGAMIMPGVTVGEGAVVGAGSIVLHDVARYSIVVGAPARVVKQRKDYAPPGSAEAAGPVRRVRHE